MAGEAGALTARRSMRVRRRWGGRRGKHAAKRAAWPAAMMAVGAVLVAIAAALSLFPTVSARWWAIQAQRQFTQQRATASMHDAAEVDRAISTANAYNAKLAEGGAGPGAGAYSGQLALGDGEPMCWVDVPKLNIVVPVYRDDGTDDVPSEGAEHLMGTSLPVGGMPSNTVITAHSGSAGGVPMPFNMLDRLQGGDAIVLWTLGRPYCYEVTGSETVAPSDVGALLKVGSADEVTLLTCWPIGTSAKRLVVHAKRAEVAQGGADIVKGADIGQGAGTRHNASVWQGAYESAEIRPGLLERALTALAAIMFIAMAAAIVRHRRAKRHEMRGGK